MYVLLLFFPKFTVSGVRVRFSPTRKTLGLASRAQNDSECVCVLWPARDELHVHYGVTWCCELHRSKKIQHAIYAIVFTECFLYV